MVRHIPGESYANFLLNRLRLFLLGNPLATSVQLEHRLPIFLALPVFASDAISSVAYGPEEILKELSKASGNLWQHYAYLLPISLAIAVLMLIVATSYRRAVTLYPTSGGSYTVAKSNLGPFVGLVAAAALLIDYILTVSVSIAAGVDALTSAYPVLSSVHVWIAVILVLFIAIINLRGTKESGAIFAIPMYSFAILVGAMIVGTLFRLGAHYFYGTPIPTIDPASVPDPIHQSPVVRFGLFLVLRAFSNGCSAMTGVEAVSNGVSAFQPPESKNAAKTLALLVIILISLFLGTSFAAHVYHAIPASETILSQVTRATFGHSIIYYLTQLFTTLILMVAANTSFADFPRLLAFVAKDGFAPKTFVTQGDRLVYNRGIIMLTIVSVILIIAFQAQVTLLIGLYSIGVFVCFTLSQLGMAKKIHGMNVKGRVQATVINLIGAFFTGLVSIVVAVSKFSEGAWMVLVLIPLIIWFCLIIRRHYDWFERTMTLHPDDFNPLRYQPEPLTVLVLVSSDIHRGILEGIECGRAIAEYHPESVLRAVHIEMDPEKTHRLRDRWAEYVEPYLCHKIRLDIVPSPYRWLIEPILEYLDRVDLERNNDRIIIVLPEFETGNPLTHFLHNFTGHRLRQTLLNRPHVTVVSSRFFMKPLAWQTNRKENEMVC